MNFNQGDWEMLIIARNETAKARHQCIASFNNFTNPVKKAFFWDGVQKKTKDLNEINEWILELEAEADTNSNPPFSKQVC